MRTRWPTSLLQVTTCCPALGSAVSGQPPASWPEDSPLREAEPGRTGHCSLTGNTDRHPHTRKAKAAQCLPCCLTLGYLSLILHPKVPLGIWSHDQHFLVCVRLYISQAPFCHGGGPTHCPLYLLISFLKCNWFCGIQPNYILKCVFHNGLYKTGLISICTLLLPLIPASAREEVGAPQSFYV